MRLLNKPGNGRCYWRLLWDALSLQATSPGQVRRCRQCASTNEAPNGVPPSDSLRFWYAEVKATACRDANLLQPLTVRIMSKTLSLWRAAGKLRQLAELSQAASPASGGRDLSHHA